MSGKKGITWKALTQQEFDKATALSGYGLSIKQIGTLVGKSPATISRIREAKDFADYKAKIIETRRKYHGVTTAEAQAETQAETQVETPSQPDNTVMVKLMQNINDLMVKIDQRLEFVEEHIEVVPKRKLFR